MDASNKIHLACIISVVFISCTRANAPTHYSCGKLNTIGCTVPRGDITLRYGESLNITCNLNEDLLTKYGENASSRLYFTRNKERISKSMVKVLNSTSIELYIEEPSKVEHDDYYCFFNDREKDVMVCFNVVIVGVRPQNVTDFSCLSRNHDNLTCTWTPPNNYVTTNYDLTYSLRGRAARKEDKLIDPKTRPTGNEVKSALPKKYAFQKTRKSYHRRPKSQTGPFQCPKLTFENGQWSCFWNLSTTPQYRQSHILIYFILYMNNTFGSEYVNFTFKHFEHVLPNPPENLTAVPTSPHSINLSWVVPPSLKSFAPGVHHRILYQCEYYKKIWQFAKLILDCPKNETLQYELTNLKYAHVLCDIRVSMRSAVADPNDESMWSNNATTTARTKSKIPDCPPETNLGSFEIVSNRVYRDAYIYWKQIRQDQKNGQNFTYKIVVENDPLLRPSDLTKAYAKFQNLSVKNYVIHIWSQNEEGLSREKSTVIIPAKRLPEPQNFIKLAHGEDLYELSWEPPPSEDVITNYTIFWCNNERDRPYQCLGNLHWKVVPYNILKYNQTLPTNIIYQFAISANSHCGSSGMSWAECTIIANRNMGKMKNVWINQVGPDFMEVRWKIDCFNQIGIVKGFIIFYCPIISPVQSVCKEPLKNVTIHGDKSIQSGRVENLKPHTTYQLTVSVIINHSTYSQSSEPMYNSTNEKAPSSPPLDITAYNVTNSSISLKWTPPTVTNGVLKYYIVHYNGMTLDTANHTNVTLTGLMSFVNYSISVQACTVNCSEFSSPLTVLTKMWRPAKIKTPAAILINDSIITIGWEKPDPPRGQLNYYQVKIMEKRDMGKDIEPDLNITNAQNYSIKSCESGKYNTFFIFVRAVNIIDGEHQSGPWSDPMESYCKEYSLIYIIFGVLLIFVAAAVFAIFKKLYARCKIMQDVEVKLPPGLAPVVERDLVPWGPEKRSEDRTSRADEELLLQKISEGRLSGDSSGCSSGHESITSSLESATHMSTSDSGTEQPRSLNEENRRNSLRQRNVSSKGYVLPDAIPTTVSWGPQLNPQTSGNYCVLGVDPATPTEKPTQYVSLTDSNMSLSLPYPTCDLPSQPTTGDFIKTPNPGYVPYTSTEPASKNTGYVLAGLTKDTLVPDLIQCDKMKLKSLEEKPRYVKSADNLTNFKGAQYAWQQSAIDNVLPKSGYVSVGDALPLKAVTESTKGYVPHRQFEAKCLKED